MFFAYNMIDFASKECVVFMKQTVLAEIIGTQNHKAAQGRADMGDAHNLLHGQKQTGSRFCQTHQVFHLYIIV